MNKDGFARDPRADNNPNKKQPAKKLDRKTAKGIFLRLSGYLMKHWPLFLLAILLTLASNHLALLGPKFSGNAIDTIAAENRCGFSSGLAECRENAGMLYRLGHPILSARSFDDTA